MCMQNSLSKCSLVKVSSAKPAAQNSWIPTAANTLNRLPLEFGNDEYTFVRKSPASVQETFHEEHLWARHRTSRVVIHVLAHELDIAAHWANFTLHHWPWFRKRLCHRLTDLSEDPRTKRRMSLRRTRTHVHSTKWQPSNTVPLTKPSTSGQFNFTGYLRLSETASKDFSQ